MEEIFFSKYLETSVYNTTTFQFGSANFILLNELWSITPWRGVRKLSIRWRLIFCIIYWYHKCYSQQKSFMKLICNFIVYAWCWPIIWKIDSIGNSHHPSNNYVWCNTWCTLFTLFLLICVVWICSSLCNIPTRTLTYCMWVEVN